MSVEKCTACGTRLFWPEKHDGVCRPCQPNIEPGPPPYPQFCLHAERCSGFSSCPRDYSCVE